MGGAGFLVIIIAFGFLYFVLIRPQKKRQLASQRMLNELHVGDEVVTAGGIYGEIAGLGDEDVTVRIAPELDVRVARRAIASVITSAAPEPGELEAPEEPEPDATGPTPGT
jgi:preprotein translocase subunit YajC